MKKLRNRVYLALLPLQLLLIGLVVWTFFLLNNLTNLIDQSRQDQEALNNAFVRAIDELNEMGRLLAAPEFDSEVFLHELQSAKDEYYEAVSIIENDSFTKQSSYRQQVSRINEQLMRRIQLINNDPNGIAPEPRVRDTIETISRAKGLLGQFAAVSISEIMVVQRDFRERIRISIYVLTAGIVLCVAGTILISYQIGHLILNPLEKLQDKLDELTSGNYNVEIRINRKDELGHLAEAFNRMARSLRHYRNMTDQRLTRTTKTFQSVLQRSPNAILFLTDKLRVFYANPQADELLGAPECREGIPGKLAKLATDTLDGQNIRVQNNLNDAIQVKVYGEPRYYLLSSFPVELLTEDMKISDKSADGVALLLQDVTKMKLADNIKGNLVATVSHELKTPLTSSRMALYLLSEGQVGSLTEPQLELVNTAKEDLDRQLATIQNLMDLSRIEASEQAVTMEACQIQQIINASIEAHAELAKSSNIVLDVQHHDGTIDIWADPHRLTIVLNNFLSNALRHSPRDETIVIESRVEASEVRCSVRDRGPGIDKSLIPQLFDRYIQGSDNAKTGSVGLGLHIAKEIIDEHGGTIGCEPSEGGGTTFYFTLPLTEPSHNTQPSTKNGNNIT